MKNKVFILLDRSGSMDTMWNEALGGINGYVKGIKNADVMLATFDSVSYDVIRNVNVDDWKTVTVEDVQPRGGTPLLDSAGRMLHTVLDSGAEKAILVVVTDGYENASSKFSKGEIANLTKKLTEDKKYEIVFLGANFDKVDDVVKTNFGYSDMSRIVPTSVKGFGSTMSVTSTRTMDYFNTGSTVGTSFYSDEDKKKAKQ